MTKNLFILSIILVVALIPINADTLTYTNITVAGGQIDGVSLTGQTATISIEFASGLTATGNVYNLGPITSATYEFSSAGLFTVDNPQSDLQFGSVSNGSQTFELSFFDPGFSPLGMLSGTTAGNIGLDPLNGETLSDFFARVGNGSSISFVQTTSFQMLNSSIGTLNGGTSNVTNGLTGAAGSQVTLTLNAVNSVPEPSTYLAMLLTGLGMLIFRKKANNTRG